MKNSPEFKYKADAEKFKKEVPKAEQEIAMKIFEEENKEESKDKELENKIENKESAHKFEIYSNNKYHVETMRSVTSALDFPPFTMIDVNYSKENKGKNYGELLKLIQDKIEKEGIPVILYGDLSEIHADIEFQQLLGYKRVGFIDCVLGGPHYPHYDDWRIFKEFVTKINELPNIKDELAGKAFSGSGNISTRLNHDIESRPEEAILKVNEIFGTNFDPKKDKVKVKDFLLKRHEVSDSNKRFEGKKIKGVFCDFEGTLVNIKTGELNLQILEKLDGYDKKEFVHIWTGGDIEKAKDFVRRQNRTWLVLPKQDFYGSEPEIVIDDLSEKDFEKQYSIKSQKFINVKDISK